MTTRYSCHAFHDSLPNGRSSGSLDVKPYSITFHIGETSLELSIDALELSMGGANNRLIFFSHKDFPDWSFYTSERDILKDPHLLAHAHTAKALGGARRHHQRSWFFWSIAAVAIVVLPVYLLLRMDVVMEFAVKNIPPEWEETLGESAIAQQRIAQPFMDQEQSSDLLAPLISPLLSARDNERYDYRFHIVSDPTINAMALPGGEVIIHSRLILEAESAEELLGVLAHEMIHVERQHGLRNVAGAAGVYVVVSAIFGDVSGILAAFSSAIPVLLNQSYSRGFEEEADREGYNLLVKANIDPSGLHDFFQRLKLQEQEQLEELGDEQTQELVTGVMSYLSSHPATDKRIKVLNKLLENVKYDNNYLNLDTEFHKLKDAVENFSLAGRKEDTNDEK